MARCFQVFAWITLFPHLVLSQYVTGAGDGYDSQLMMQDFTLPVALSDFQTTVVDEKGWIQIRWTTESEIDIQWWLLFRKTQSDTLTLIHVLPGKGWSASQASYRHTDNEVQPGIQYMYRLSSMNSHGHVVLHAEGTGMVSPPERFQLLQNFPNPFNPSTRIRFFLSTSTRARLLIFNSLGQHVTTLLDANLSSGWHAAEWNGTTNAGVAVSSGVYFYRLQAGETSQTKKLIFSR